MPHYVTKFGARSAHSSEEKVVMSVKTHIWSPSDSTYVQYVFRCASSDLNCLLKTKWNLRINVYNLQSSNYRMSWNFFCQASQSWYESLPPLSLSKLSIFNFFSSSLSSLYSSFPSPYFTTYYSFDINNHALASLFLWYWLFIDPPHNFISKKLI